MRKFRLLLTLVLCLTVPLAGWASVLSGPLCPQRQHQSHEHAADVVDADGDCAGSNHHHQVVGDHDKPCQGEHCGCGCGMGACSTAGLALAAHLSASLVMFARDQTVPSADTVFRADARGGSPLRPPIS